MISKKVKIYQNKSIANHLRLYKEIIEVCKDFPENSDVLLVQIGNFDFIKLFIEKNPTCKVTIIDLPLRLPFYKMFWPNVSFFSCEENKETINTFINLNKLFDRILIWSQPSTSRNDLKLLKICESKLKKHGKSICIHPSKWERDIIKYGIAPVPITSYKELTNHEDIIGIFNDDTFGKVSITLIEKDNVTKFITNSTINLIQKIMNNFNFETREKYCTKTPISDYSIKVKNDHQFVGKESGLYSTNYKICIKILPTTGYISYVNFKTEKELLNFFNTSINSILIKFLIYKTQYRTNLIWVGNLINPRNGKRGYATEWTDDDFRIIFNISDNEWKYIKKEVNDSA